MQGSWFGKFTPESRQVVVGSQDEARLRSHRQIFAADMLVALASCDPVLVTTTFGDAGLTATRLREASPVPNGPTPLPPERHIPFAEDARSALRTTARVFKSRDPAKAPVTPAHLLAGLVASPGLVATTDSTAIRVLAIAHADLNLARSRVVLVLDATHGAAITGRRGLIRRRRAAEPDAPADSPGTAQDQAAVSAYVKYVTTAGEASGLMAEGRYQDAEDLWRQLTDLHPSEPRSLINLAACLDAAGRWDAATALLARAMAVTRPEYAMGAMPRNYFAWCSVTGELFANGAVSDRTLALARQAAQDAVARLPNVSHIDTLALIQVLDGHPAKAADLLRPILTRSLDGSVAEDEAQHLATIEATCALAYAALGDARVAQRLIASARGREVTAYAAKYVEWAESAIRDGRVPGSGPQLPR
jgi:hypothetical protein